MKCGRYHGRRARIERGAAGMPTTRRVGRAGGRSYFLDCGFAFGCRPLLLVLLDQYSSGHIEHRRLYDAHGGDCRSGSHVWRARVTACVQLAST